MSYILNIETATDVCSVAISQGREVIFEKESKDGPSHATLLGVFVNEAVLFARSQSIKLDAVAVSCGPGSYTGLRIGVSEAKGICYGFNIPLIAIKTPLILAQRVVETENIDNNALLCPMIDARRMEVYSALYDNSLNEVREIRADIVDQDTYKEYLEKSSVYFFGNGAEKCMTTIANGNAQLIDNVYPSAKYMARLAEQAFLNKEFVDVAYFEPFYLKDFVTTVSKKNIF